jgi:hypothetical protein
MAATGANQVSSRSHAILIVQLEARHKSQMDQIVYSKL